MDAMILSPASMMYAFLVVGQGTMAARLLDPGGKSLMKSASAMQMERKRPTGSNSILAAVTGTLAVVSYPGCRLLVPPKLLYITFLASTSHSLWGLTVNSRVFWLL